MKRGFTLVELSIVLVIIGILLGGIVKGMSMVENARLKRIKQDVDGIVTAVNLYMDQYGALPGDDARNRTGFAPGCDGTQGGNTGNGRIDTTEEQFCFWKELAGAGFISGDVTVNSIEQIEKRSPYGTAYKILYRTTTNRNGNAIVVDGVPSDKIESLDIRFDDSDPARGDILMSQDGQAGTDADTSYPTAVTDRTLNWFAL